MKFVLPLPDALNAWPKHPMAEHRAKRKYQRHVWALACSQHKPSHDPPARVAISATFYLRTKPRDEDGLTGSLKWLLDALKRNQHGKLDWRGGIADEKGFFIDDGPDRVTVAKPVQLNDHANPRIEIDIVPIEGNV